MATTRGKPFGPGNPGRPKGARHRVTLAIEALLDGQAEALTQAAINRALAGDPIALRLCLDRIAPPRRDRPVTFRVPRIKSASDVPAALATILSAASRGALTPSEAGSLAGLVSSFIAATEAVEFEARLGRLEAAADIA